jgi:chromosome segregation ATPase
METHPKIEALESQRDLLSSAARGLDAKIDEAREELLQADTAIAQLESHGVRASDAQAIRVRADRDRRAEKLELLRKRRKTIDADRARCGQLAERLGKWWREHGART